MSKQTTSPLRHVTIIALLLLGAGLGWLFFAPVPFDPAPDTPFAPNPAGTGVYSGNNLLAEARHVASGEGPEGIAFDAAGRLYTGLHDGRILRFDVALQDAPEEMADTGGRPLGIEFDAKGNLIIADAEKGLLSMSPDGTLTVLTTHVNGRRMIFVDDVAIADDGKIYFSDASQNYSYGHEIIEIFERRPSGRLLVFDPATQETRVLLDDLFFANGVAMGPQDAFVLVNETFGHRIMRYWLSGEKAGTADIFADNFPGYLDNITEAPGGGYWLAVVAPRVDEIDALVDKPFWRKVVWRIMDLTGGSPAEMHSRAVRLDANGTAQMSLDDGTGHIFMMTSVIEENGQLFLGSTINDVIGVIDAP
ncbi:MAG: SMP-30/gluconolactonase/LRE family protein [Rhodobiaceae bacterium]